MTWWPSSLPEYDLETLETRQGENLLLPVKYCNCALGKSRILTQRVRLLSGAAQAQNGLSHSPAPGCGKSYDKPMGPDTDTAINYIFIDKVSYNYHATYICHC